MAKADMGWFGANTRRDLARLLRLAADDLDCEHGDWADTLTLVEESIGVVRKVQATWAEVRVKLGRLAARSN